MMTTSILPLSLKQPIKTKSRYKEVLNFSYKNGRYLGSWFARIRWDSWGRQTGGSGGWSRLTFDWACLFRDLKGLSRFGLARGCKRLLKTLGLSFLRFLWIFRDGLLVLTFLAKVILMRGFLSCLVNRKIVLGCVRSEGIVCFGLVVLKMCNRRLLKFFFNFYWW